MGRTDGPAGGGLAARWRGRADGMRGALTTGMARSYQIAGCPACGCEAAELVADWELLKSELEDLWQFHLNRRRPGVPVGQLYDRAYYTQAPPLQLVECEGCGTLYRNPREADREIVSSYTEERTDPSALESLFRTQRRLYGRQLEMLTKLAKPARGIELGSYVGAFLDAAGKRGWKFEGVDVNADAVAFARGKGLTAHQGTLGSIPADPVWGAIAIWNCFDQLPDPRATLLEAHARLRRGGLLAIRVPNGSCYLHYHNGVRPKRVARLVLAHNNLLGFPYRQGFTPESLSAVIEHAGFEVIDLRGDTLVPLADEWTKGWAVYQEKLLQGMLRYSPLSRAPWFEAYAIKT
jgi:hypothetical protein